MPTLPSLSAYRISFSGPASVDPVVVTSTSASIELAVGTWAITVEGLDSSDETVVSGSAAGVVVTSGAATPVSINLTALTSGTGTINVTVAWTSDVSPVINGYSVSLDGAAVASGSVASGTYQVAYSSSRAAGSYKLTFTLASATGTRAVVTESVQVFGNLDSAGTISLTSSDFTLPPAAPGGLTVSEGLAQVNMSWTDNSYVETSYRVDRSTNQTTWTTLSSSLAANTASYSDASAVSGTTYYYRVYAVNAQGASGYDAANGSWAPPVAGASGALGFGTVTTSAVPVTWTAATDAVTAQSDLSYRLYYSASNNISTAALALTNGAAATSWTTTATSGTASGLSASTTYWFNVLARDAAGNVGCYAASSATAASTPGSVTLTITVSSPTDATITFSRAADVVVSQSSTLNVSVSETFTSYQWIVDDTDTWVTTSSLSLVCSSLSVGVHHLYLFVKRNGLTYSRSLRFIVRS